MFENGAMPYWYDWGPEEADRLAGEIVAEKTSGKMPAAERRAVFSYGMPGSGKSRLIEGLGRKDVSLAVLSIDEIFQRSPHFADIVRPPRFNRHDDPFSDRAFMEFGGDVMGYAIERLKEMPYSVAVDGLGGQMLPQMYKYLEKSGYRTRIVVAAVPKRIMDMNMLTRFIAVRTGGDRHFSFALERSKKMVEYYASYVDSLQKLGFELQIVNPADGRNLGGNRASAGFLKEFSRPLTAFETAELRRRRELLLPRVEKVADPVERRQLRNAHDCCLRPFAAPEYKFSSR